MRGIVTRTCRHREPSWWHRLGSTIGTLGATGILTLASPARAAERQDFVNPGVIFSFVAGPSPATGAGVELSIMSFPKEEDPDDCFCGVGLFLQAQTYNFDHGRYALGAQFGGLLGAEVGVAYRGAHDDVGDALGLHLSAFGSLGFAYVALRGTIAMVGESGENEIGAVVGLKLPIPPTGFFTMGRPLRGLGGRLIPPAFVTANLELARHAPLATHLDAATRMMLGFQWLAAAQEEYASAPAFVQLAAELRAVGAPSTLVHAAVLAAYEEIHHARCSLDLANALAGVRFGLGPMPQLPAQRGPLSQMLRRLALESLQDGCLGEGTGAEQFLRQAKSAPSETVAETLLLLGTQEKSHAELAWAVLAFCLDQGGKETRDAVAEELDTLRRCPSDKARPEVAVHPSASTFAPPSPDNDVAELSWAVTHRAQKLFYS